MFSLAVAMYMIFTGNYVKASSPNKKGEVNASFPKSSAHPKTPSSRASSPELEGDEDVGSTSLPAADVAKHVAMIRARSRQRFGGCAAGLPSPGVQWHPRTARVQRSLGRVRAVRPGLHGSLALQGDEGPGSPRLSRTSRR